MDSESVSQEAFQKIIIVAKMKNLPKTKTTSTGLRIFGTRQSGICAFITAYRKHTSNCFSKSVSAGLIIAQPETS
jgi:hypothetical protein